MRQNTAGRARWAWTWPCRAQPEDTQEMLNVLPKAFLYQYTQHTMLYPVSFRCWHGKGTHKNTNDQHILSSCKWKSQWPQGDSYKYIYFLKTYRVKIVLILEINASKHHKSKIYAPLLRLVLQDKPLMKLMKIWYIAMLVRPRSCTVI